MKKVYSMTALALAVSLSAAAASPVAFQKAQVANAEAIVAVENVGTGVAGVPVVANGPAKEITSTDQLTGMKKWTGILMFGEKEYNGTVINGPQAGVAFGEDPRATRITIQSFPSSDLSLRLNVDLDKKEVSFTNGVYVGQVTTQTGVKEVYINVRKIVGDIVYDDTDGLYKYSERPEDCGEDEEIIGKILDDGTISFEGYAMLAQSPDMVEQGSVYLMLNTANVSFTNTPWNTPVESEYTYLGEGEYDDCFFRSMFNDPSIVPVNKKAQIYTKKEGDNVMIAVKNPYKNVAGTVPTSQGEVEVTDFWKEVEVMYADASGDGWLLFEVFKGDKFSGYPNAAACIPMVDCGMVTDDSEDGDGSELTNYYPYNDEGETVYSGGEDAYLDILESYKLSNTDYTVVKDDVLYIYNTHFGITYAPLTPYWWGETEHPVGTLTLPEGWDGGSGIKNVLFDSENGPVKYYNLQGVEVAAPVKGQLVIKTQGGKSTKFIAR